MKVDVVEMSFCKQISAIPGAPCDDGSIARISGLLTSVSRSCAGLASVLLIEDASDEAEAEGVIDSIYLDNRPAGSEAW